MHHNPNTRSLGATGIRVEKQKLIYVRSADRRGEGEDIQREGMGAKLAEAYLLGYAALFLRCRLYSPMFVQVVC